MNLSTPVKKQGKAQYIEGVVKQNAFTSLKDITNLVDPPFSPLKIMGRLLEEGLASFIATGLGFENMAK